MKKTILVFLVTLSLLVSIPISVLGSCDGGNINILTDPTEDPTPSFENPIYLSKTIWNMDSWNVTKEAELNETVRFNITITYFDTDGEGIGEKIKHIVVRDEIPIGLEYAGNATLDPTISDDEKTITWNLSYLYIALYDNESYFLEFDAKCISSGVQENLVNVTALHKCYSKTIYKEATAIVNVDTGGNDCVKPEVEIIKPLEKTLYIENEKVRSLLFMTRIIGPITIEVNASDNGSGLDKIVIMIDDEIRTTINATNNSNLFNWTWNESFLLPRFHTIKVVAYDKNGNNESDEVNVLKMGNFNFFRNHPKLSLLLAGVAGLLLLNKLRGGSGEGDGDDGSDKTMTDPVANPGGPYSGKILEEIEFDGSDSYDPNEDKINYRWDFGDGNTADGKNPVHAYNQPGKYTVTLTVTDGDGNSGVLTTEVIISSSDDVEGESDGDGDGIFWYIVSALGAILLLCVGALYVGRKFYV